jgi:hypothetical protein
VEESVYLFKGVSVNIEKPTTQGGNYHIDQAKDTWQYYAMVDTQHLSEMEAIIYLKLEFGISFVYYDHGGYCGTGLRSIYHE